MSDELRERLADVQHAIWAHWTRWQFSVCQRNEDGSLTIPAPLVERWTRQMDTPYADLSEREKDSDRRCDIPAGMAKLLGARVAWSNADNALQIHGGNGYAEEYPISRVLCDARILNIFEGAAEIQAHVVARRLLDGGN